jgi:hypothetical protein
LGERVVNAKAGNDEENDDGSWAVPEIGVQPDDQPFDLV